MNENTLKINVRIFFTRAFSTPILKTKLGSVIRALAPIFTLVNF